MQSRVSLRPTIEALEKAGVDGMITQQIVQDGLGSDLYVEDSKVGTIRLNNIIEYVYYQ